MKHVLTLAIVAVVAATANTVLAAENAATSELPAALQALGGESSVISTAQAQTVRGQGGFDLTQTKSFSVTGGTAVGTTNLLEGVFGSFTYTKIGDDMSTLVVEGTFGGLAGSIGVGDDGALNFQFGGKALQESLSFVGKFDQEFFQSYNN